MEVLLHGFHVVTHLLEQMEGDHANRAVLKGDRIAVVFVGTYPVEPERFPCDMKAGDLLIAVAMHHDGLEAAGAHRIDALEGVACVIQRFTAPDEASGTDNG